MILPAPLAPWAPFLEEFPLQVAPALGAMAHRLDALLGRLGSDFEAPDGEVDGYDGISRRGLPERMLLSDWLLADEAPDEWARRAAEGELSYLQLARRTPQRTQAVIVLFDAGPDALGAPRLGQLAALLVLARRACEMGASLQWGIAGQPTDQIWHDFSPSSVRALLAARQAAPVTEAQIEAWREVLGDIEVPILHQERWLVGGASLSNLAAPSEAVLRFEEPFEAAFDVPGDEAAYLEATASSSRGVQRARLELPRDVIATRLLRDPLGSTPSEVEAQVRRIKPSMAPQGNLLWLNGHTLAAQTRDNGAVVFRVPSSPRGGVGKPKHYHLSNRYPVHFLGEIGGAFLAGFFVPEGVRTEVLGGKTTDAPVGSFTGKMRASTAPLRPLWSLGQQLEPSKLFLVCDEELLELDFDPRREADYRGKILSVSTGVKAAQHGPNTILGLVSGVPKYEMPPRLVTLSKHARTTENYQTQSSNFLENRVSENAPYAVIDAAFWGNFFGNPVDQTQKILAFQTDKWWLRWWENQELRLQAIEVPSGQFVRGVIAWQPKFSTPALILCGSNARGLQLLGVGWRHHIDTSDVILRVSTSPTLPYLAWTTPTELVVYSLAQEVVLARWQWEASE